MSATELTENELPAVGFLADFTDEDRQKLSSFGEFLPGNKDIPLIEEGSEQPSLYFVISGKLHAQTMTDGRRVLLGALGAGDVIGEVNVFDPGAASATVVPAEFSQLWRLSRSDFSDILETEPLLASNILIAIATQLSRRLRHTNEKVTYVRAALLDTGLLS